MVRKTIVAGSVALLLIFIPSCSDEFEETGLVVSPVTDQLSEQSKALSPHGGPTDASLELGEANPTLLEIKVFYPQIQERIQSIIENNDGSEEQVFFLSLDSNDIEANGRYIQGSQFDYVHQLDPGTNSIRVLRDGLLLFGPVLFEVEKPAPPEPDAPAGPELVTPVRGPAQTRKGTHLSISSPVATALKLDIKPDSPERSQISSTR